MNGKLLMVAAALAAGVAGAADLAGEVDAGWAASMEKCWSPKTSLVYTCAPEKVRPAKAFDDGPGYYRFQKGVKGKSHYGEGMGDCALICGTALSGLVDRYLVAGDAETKATAAKVARGVLNLAVLHGFRGFVARGICVEDGKSVCSLSSRDQYTHWLHGLLRYVESGMADAAFRKEFTAEAVHVAEYMERLCTPERNWNFGMVDGSPDPRGICTMWGPDLHPHEQARLPMIYGVAWRLSGDAHWKNLYENYVDEALEKSQGMAVEKETRVMPCYSLLQAMCSFEAILSFEKAPARVAKLRAAMTATAGVAAKRARRELADSRVSYYGMCEDGELSLTMAMLPGGVDAALERDFLARTVTRRSLVTAGTCRAAHVYAAYWRNRMRDVGWRVKDLNGAPALFRDGTPVPPVIFWQWDLQEQDVKAMSGAGIELFSMFGSFGHYEHPYWTEKGFGGLAYQEGNIDQLLAWNPEACFLPRIFSAAPDWWIEANPDEQIRYTNPGPVAGRFWAKARESFASEKCRAELSPVYRQVVRRLYGRYGKHLIGIHVTNGPWGENFAWDGYTQAGGAPLEKAGYSDSSAPMTRAFRAFLREKYEGDERRLRAAWKDGTVTFDTAAVPTMAERLRLDETGVWRDPAAGRKVPDYFACMNRVTVGLVDHYAGLVKDESKGRLATLAFYGYTQDEHWTTECDHRAVSQMYSSPNVDMFSAPHTYHRRSPGEDGEMRCYLASAALHGKLFIDESDDRTHLELAKPHPDARCSATNMYESLNLLYRAFGNAVTHGVGLWYMDLARDSFRAPELVDAVGRMRQASAESLRHDRSHISEVAVVSNVESEFYMGYRRTEANNVSLLLYLQQMGAFYRCGAPFDWYLAEDLDAVVRRGYKVVVLLDCQYLTERQRAQVEELKRDGRTLVTFHAPGYVSATGLSRDRMEGVCGVKMRPGTFRGVLSAVDAATGVEWGCGLDRVIDGVGDRPLGVRHRTPGTAQKGLFLPEAGADVRTLMTGVGELKGVPVAVERKRDGWTGVFSALPALAPDVLRRIYREAGVHLYTERDVVLSANRAWLMLHTREAGDYPVVLPRKARKVTDVTCGKVVAEDADRFTYPLKKFQTAVFLFE